MAPVKAPQDVLEMVRRLHGICRRSVRPRIRGFLCGNLSRCVDGREMRRCPIHRVLSGYIIEQRVFLLLFLFLLLHLLPLLPRLDWTYQRGGELNLTPELWCTLP